MAKYLFVFLLGVVFCNSAIAQKSDTLIYFLKFNGDIVADKTSADYIISVQPPDTTDANLYVVKQYYKDGKVKLLTKSSINTLPLRFQGPCVEFFENGHRHAIANFSEGALLGDDNIYYPNGKQYILKNYPSAKSPKSKLIECRDSTGKILCTNGNGYWIAYDSDFKNSSEGPVVNGQENGDWKGFQGDSIKFTITYKKGEVVSGIGYDKAGKAYPFKKIYQDPSFGHGVDEFFNFIGRTKHYPDYAAQHDIHGTVVIGFSIETDGLVDNINIITAAAPSLNDEAVRIINLSPLWVPGKLYGMPAVMKRYVRIDF